MKIRDLDQQSIGGRVRVSARVEWEDSSRAPLEIYYETGASFEDDVAANPNAFLTACVLPAMRQGEKRIALEGPVCPRLCEGLSTAGALLRSWWGAPRGEVRIESARGFRAPVPRRPSRSALFFTGGVDSLHLLRRNQIDYPRAHSESFQDAIAVFGLLRPVREAPAAPDTRDVATLNALSSVTAEAGLRLVPITTNLTLIEPDLDFFAKEFIGAALSSAAHLLSPTVSSISLASGRNVPLLVPLGTHPLLDPCFSSGALEVRHVGLRFSRIQRFREVCEWDRAIRSLVVCLHSPPPPYLNCGRCEKCLRTMTALAAFGRLADARLFPVTEISAAMVDSAAVTPHVAGYWRELLGPLRDARRNDLTAAVERRLDAANQTRGWFEEEGWKGTIRKLDRRFLGGAALRIRRALWNAAK